MTTPRPEWLSGADEPEAQLTAESYGVSAEHQGRLVNRIRSLGVANGVLHLGGYDHENDTGQMARREALLRRRFGLAAGLIERTGTTGGRR